MGSCGPGGPRQRGRSQRLQASSPPPPPRFQFPPWQHRCLFNRPGPLAQGLWLQEVTWVPEAAEAEVGQRDRVAGWAGRGWGHRGPRLGPLASGMASGPVGLLGDGTIESRVLTLWPIFVIGDRGPWPSGAAWVGCGGAVAAFPPPSMLPGEVTPRHRSCPSCRGSRKRPPPVTLTLPVSCPRADLPRARILDAELCVRAERGLRGRQGTGTEGETGKGFRGSPCS